MLKLTDEGVVFPTSYLYTVQAWRWRGDIEERVAGTVHQVVNDIKNKKAK